MNAKQLQWKTRQPALIFSTL